MEDAPAETFPFQEGVAVSDKTVKYVKTFEPAFGGEQPNVFHIFESLHPVHIVLRGAYDGIPIRLKMELPRIERNKVYELSVLNVGATVEGIFEIKPWEEGETVTGKPDADHRILLDASRSVIPEGVSVDYENNIVEVPMTGVDGMQLAFLADTRIDIASAEGVVDGVMLTDMTVSEEAEGIVSSFSVSVPAQGSGRLGYSFMVHLKNALMTGSYDFVEVRVAPSDKQIETVEMAGNVWMAFNARSRDLEDQIYVPWQGYNPSNNLGNQTADMPWQNDSHMPCPEGYRVPTRNELNSLFPKGQEIPGTYTAGNGERITATLHVGEGTLVTPTGVTGTQHYVKFTSEDTGRYLIIPLAGGKGDKSTTNNPAFGKRAILWTSQRDGCPGGYAWAYWMRFEGKDSTVIAEQRLQMEAFASLRCVKK